jgi:hypothetical protein
MDFMNAGQDVGFVAELNAIRATQSFFFIPVTFRKFEALRQNIFCYESKVLFCPPFITLVFRMQRCG